MILAFILLFLIGLMLFVSGFLLSPICSYTQVVRGMYSNYQSTASALMVLSGIVFMLKALGLV